MAEAELRITFDGPIVASGRMDARCVGQTLVAVSDLASSAKATDPALRDASTPDVRVASFNQGSFDIQVILEGLGDAWVQIRHLAAGEDVTAVANMTAVIGAAVDMIKVFGKRRVVSQEVDQSGTEVTVEFEGGEPRRATMPAEVFLAFMSLPVRNAARRVIEPVEREGVEAITLTARPAGESVRVAKEDAPNFHAEEPAAPQESTTRRTNQGSGTP